MVAGSDTFINELLKLNHFQNIYENKGRYPEIEKKIRLEGDRLFGHRNRFHLKNRQLSCHGIIIKF
jgi:hypothetical protein